MMLSTSVYLDGEIVFQGHCQIAKLSNSLYEYFFKDHFRGDTQL